MAATARAEPTAAERETARQLMERGRDRLDDKNYKAALEAFKAADDIMQVPSTGLQVGNAQMELGLLVEARDTFGRVARSPAVANEPAPFARAREASERAYVALEARIPALRFAVRGATGEVEVRVDDVAVASSAQRFPYRVNPGRHVVVAKTATSTANAEVDVAEGATKEVVLNMSEGTPVAPAVAGEAPSGGGADRPGRTSTLTYVGFGVAGAGIVAGTITGVLMFSKKSALDDECNADKQCPRDSSLSGAYAMATVSTVSFIVAGVGAGVGIYGLLTRRSAPPAAAARIEPWVGLATGGLRGSF